MFYSHEGGLHYALHTGIDQLTVAVLTSRKYGVATVWFVKNTQLLLPLFNKTDRLVATLGSKSSLKRINRKQILDVDVAKACQTIVDPVVPMALRLQGNLL
jgi:meiotic recombination protein REC8